MEEAKGPGPHAISLQYTQAPGPSQGVVIFLQVQEDCIYYQLFQGRNLPKQFDLEGVSPCTATCPEPGQEVVVGDGGGEAVIENHHHCLPYHLHEAYAAIVPFPFQDQDHRLPGRLLYDYSVSKR